MSSYETTLLRGLIFIVAVFLRACAFCGDEACGTVVGGTGDGSCKYLHNGQECAQLHILLDLS